MSRACPAASKAMCLHYVITELPGPGNLAWLPFKGMSGSLGAEGFLQGSVIPSLTYGQSSVLWFEKSEEKPDRVPVCGAMLRKWLASSGVPTAWRGLVILYTMGLWHHRDSSLSSGFSNHETCGLGLDRDLEDLKHQKGTNLKTRNAKKNKYQKTKPKS